MPAVLIPAADERCCAFLRSEDCAHEIAEARGIHRADSPQCQRQGTEDRAAGTPLTYAVYAARNRPSSSFSTPPVPGVTWRWGAFGKQRSGPAARVIYRPVLVDEVIRLAKDRIPGGPYRQVNSRCQASYQAKDLRTGRVTVACPCVDRIPARSCRRGRNAVRVAAAQAGRGSPILTACTAALFADKRDISQLDVVSRVRASARSRWHDFQRAFAHRTRLTRSV